jgi:ribosomal protein S18 acetylase RimI-like enzyme
MYNYIVLNRLNAPAYKHLTYHYFQKHLNLLSTQDLTTIAIGVALHGQPVGLVLVEYLKDRYRADILSLVVASGHRQQGIGTALLIQIEEILTENGCQQIDFIYPFNLTTPILERMLKQQNWSLASAHGLRCLTNLGTIEQAPFLNRYTFPQKFTIFPWSELTDLERSKIEQKENGLNYPDELCPFRSGRIEAPSSIGVRDRDKVIGWSIVEQLSPNCVSYSSLFVKPEYRSIGLGLHLLVASINRQIADRSVTAGLFLVLQENTAMTKFMTRHLAPYLTEIKTYWKSSKLIQLPVSSDRDRALSQS